MAELNDSYGTLLNNLKLRVWPGFNNFETSCADSRRFQYGSGHPLKDPDFAIFTEVEFYISFFSFSKSPDFLAKS